MTTLTITPSGAGLGATIDGLDLARPVDAATQRTLVDALGRHAVLRFPGQSLRPGELKAFAAGFGTLEVNVAGAFQDAEHPEVMTLSNIVQDGRAIGLPDAGQGWHTDMSYSTEIALANCLYALRVPRRDGVALGNTEFSNMVAAYDDLPADVKRRLDGATATHDFNKFWDMMRARPGSTRPPLTEAQRRQKPPVSQPVFLRHPLTGRTVLYANPGYAMCINGWPQRESDEMLAYLFEHQLQPKYRYAHQWTEGDVLLWDDIATIHNAIADYRANEPRHILRCQVMADRAFAEAAAASGAG